MSVTPEALLNHLAYAAWADARLLKAVSALTPEELTRDFGTADRSITGTLSHIFAADRVWLTRVLGQPSTGALAAEEQTLSFLHSAYPPLHEQWIAWASSLGVDGPALELTYRDWKGNEWCQPLWQIVLHVVNHSTHHRGQVSGFFRSLGHTPPVLDLSAFHRKQF